MIFEDMQDKLQCAGCGKRPEDLVEYHICAESDNEDTIRRYVWENEGTLNRETGAFLCDACYIAVGMPVAPEGWKVPNGFEWPFGDSTSPEV